MVSFKSKSEKQDRTSPGLQTMKKYLLLCAASLATVLLLSTASFSANAAAWVVAPSSASAISSRLVERQPSPSLICTSSRRTTRRQEPTFSLSQSSSSSSSEKETISSTDSRETKEQTPPSPANESSDDESTSKLDEKQQEFIIGYMNKHHTSLLQKFAATFSPIGREMAQANVFSGGSYAIEDAKLVDITADELSLHVVVQRRGKPAEPRTVSFPLAAAVPVVARRGAVPPPAVPEAVLQPRRAVDDAVRKLIRLCWMVPDEAAVTGKLIQLAIQLGGSGVGELPENMYLNQVPHNRYVRKWFYDKASKAILDAVILCSKGQIPPTMKIVSMFPETNPSMDSYRIGTILELVRDAAITLAEQNLRVRICVQASMGVGIFVGVPKQLNGVAKLLQMMDWQSDPGEINEGMVGDYVNFGAIGAEHVQNEERDADGNVVQQQDDVFILIAPQSMVGTDSSIIPLLQAHVKAAGDRPVILVNADLVDKVSAAGQQSVRGRRERMDFADSFKTVFHFQNIYVSGTSYFPILGAITKLHPEEPWVCHQRRDFADDGGEIYVPVLAGETKPEGESILSAFER